MGDARGWTPPPAAVRHPHLADAPPVGWVRVDMHLHTMWSGDATTTPDELREAVAESAVDVLCITDHNAVAGAEKLREELGCRVVVGEEIRSGQGELIGLFLTDRIPLGLHATEVARRVRDQGGIVYVPHPFDPLRRCLAEETLYDLAERGALDAVEALNAKVSLASLNRRAADFAAEFDLAAGAGSDAHEPSAIGAAFVEMPDFDDQDPSTFLAALSQARIVGHHYDEPRRWRARVVPSTKAL
ncbi:MAG TPA: PHP-associated domain-containing protein [Acidimicrobiales bacterium]|nr:PHP-associated domain-containing protein [Acidimicrobiales bacterium]